MSLLSFLFYADTHAQSTAYPVKPVRVYVGFAPGGATDIVARKQKLFWDNAIKLYARCGLK